MNPCQVAVLNCNRLWHDDGSLHNSFPAFIGLLNSLRVDIALIQEPRTPVFATLPTSCGFRYIGLDGTGGRDAGFLVRSSVDLEPIPGIQDIPNLIWRSLSSGLGGSITVFASFWAPHVGCPEPERLAFWLQLASSLAAVRQRFPNAPVLIAGDSNLWLSELVPSRGVRSADRASRAVLDSIISEFCLEIANPINQATHNAGAALDIILASPGLINGNTQVHNGSGCACANTDFCCPALGSDHFLITASVWCRSDVGATPAPRDSWPYIRDWHEHLSNLEAPIGRWHRRILSSEQNVTSVAQKRRLLDSLYSELCDIIWSAAPPTRQGHRRHPQPSWWTDDCYDCLVGRNAAWRERRRNFNASTDAAFRAARIRFHRAARRAWESFWESWLAETEILSMTNPRASAQRCRQQFGTCSQNIPLQMSWQSRSSPQNVSGTDALHAEREQWREHFASLAQLPADEFNSDHHARISRRAQRLRAHVCPPGRLDGPFALGELLQALSHCEDGAVGPDGIPYKALRVDLPWWQSCLLDFFRLVQRLGCVPSVWKQAITLPLWKKGPRAAASNYRPIVLTSCVAKLFERLLLQRVGPCVEPQLDNCQAGFRWGAEEQVYVLKETLRLRGRASTFCAFVDLKNAFGTCWVDAALCRLHRAGIVGNTWQVIADMFSDCQSRVRVHGGTSSSGRDSGLGQGRVMSPLLFNLVINSAAACIKRACAGVSLGSDPAAPKVSVLMYADDIVILANSADELQCALDALSDWARRWRCCFCAGPDKSAVMVVNSQCQQQSFMLGGMTLPAVNEYKYLGVVFDSRGGCKSHVNHVTRKGNQKFASCVSWCSREGLHAAWQSRLFLTYVLPAFAHGSEFLLGNQSPVNAMELQLRKWGRRILGHPSGSPNPVVLLDLGWSDMQAIALKRAASLCSRLASRWQGGARDNLPSVVFAYASSNHNSWASCVRGLLSEASVPAMASAGVAAGASRAVCRSWCQSAYPALERSSIRRCLQSAHEMDSLAEYLQYHPEVGMLRAVHSRRVSFADAREWDLARCGHHWCSDGRLSRHIGLSEHCGLCPSSGGTLAHTLLECPGTADLRSFWIAQQATSLTLRNLFEVASMQNVPAAVHFVARAVRRAAVARRSESFTSEVP